MLQSTEGVIRLEIVSRISCLLPAALSLLYAPFISLSNDDHDTDLYSTSPAVECLHPVLFFERAWIAACSLFNQILQAYNRTSGNGVTTLYTLSKQDSSGMSSEHSLKAHGPWQSVLFLRFILHTQRTRYIEALNASAITNASPYHPVG